MKTSREKLMDLSEKAMRAQGFGTFSYAVLAEQAGVRKASIHYHFSAKADLGLAVIERYGSRLDASLTAISERMRRGGEGLRGVIKMYRDALDDGDRMCLCSVLAGDTAALSPPMREALAAVNEKVIGHLEVILQAGRRDRSISVGGDIGEEARAMLAQLQGAQLIARAAGDPKLFDRTVATLEHRIFAH